MVINAQATVDSYTQPPINTPLIFNTIDAGTGLSSTVGPLPTSVSSTQFNVSWSGTDANNEGVFGGAGYAPSFGSRTFSTVCPGSAVAQATPELSVPGRAETPALQAQSNGQSAGRAGQAV
jgi:hypothetical protein